MEFGIFYEHQLPRPWREQSELQLFQEALEQVELADRLGLHYAWEVEHHFLEEYSHSSAPEVFLAACSQRTSRIRLGHGIVLMPPAYNPPARVAERIATLDLVSGGRVEFGTGESASRTELEGFNLGPADKRAMWREATEQVCNMLAMDPYPGFEGRFFSMPCRNVVPKPVQKPHPPLWLACSNRETIRVAARLGMGALTFAFVDPDEARSWVSDYHRTLARECTPIGHAVNPKVAMVIGFSCHRDADEARRRGLDGFRFFGFALGHYYLFGNHRPGRTDIWESFERSRNLLPEAPARGIGSPADLREQFRLFEDAGVDQVVFIQQGGRNRHDHICDSLELFAREVLPEFQERHPGALLRRRERLAPVIEEALARKRAMPPIGEGEIPEIKPYPRELPVTPDGAARPGGSGLAVPTRDPSESAG